MELADKYEKYRNQLKNNVSASVFNKHMVVTTALWTSFEEHLDQKGVDLLANCAEDNFLSHQRELNKALNLFNTHGLVRSIKPTTSILFSIHTNQVHDNSFTISRPCDYCQTHFFEDLHKSSNFRDLSFPVSTALLKLTPPK